MKLRDVDPSLREVMVFDYDGTLTLEDGTFPQDTKDALAKVKKLDVATLGIVSGRDLPFLRRVNESLSGVFSFLVAENGAVSYFVDTEEKLVKGADWTNSARAAFVDVNYPVYFFDIIASASVIFEKNITGTLRTTGLEAKIVLNKDSVMVMPPNVDKGVGVSSAIAHFGPIKHFRVICFGDGENDEALFGPADYSVAVSNAVPSLKLLADYVTTLPGGLGVVQFLSNHFKQLSMK